MGKIRQKAKKQSGAIKNHQKQSKSKKEKMKNKLKKVLKSSKHKPETAASSNHNKVSKTEPKSKKKDIFEEAKEKLEAARFRYLNEQLYTKTSHEAWDLFQEEPESFHVYHQGFRNQVSKWPVNPLDLIISSISKMPQSLVVADFGCGEAKLSQSVKHKVHSFDLVAANDRVTACDMSNVPLDDETVDVAVFCLSLMGTNVNDFLVEANRVLKTGGMLKVAEVESRCNNVESFVQMFKKFGFQPTRTDSSHGYFFLADFKKIKSVDKKTKLPKVFLKPCIYKKR